MSSEEEEEMEPFKTDFGSDGEFKFGGLGHKRRFTKMQQLYGDDWDESLEPEKPSAKRFQGFSGNALAGMSFTKSKTVMGDDSLVTEDAPPVVDKPARVKFAEPFAPKKKVTFAEADKVPSEFGQSGRAKQAVKEVQLEKKLE
jgi:hypothetical protein